MTTDVPNRPKPGDGVPDLGRRGFLKAAGIAGAGAVAATTAVPEQAEAQTFPPHDGPRYQLTPHIERFYFLNRL